MNDLFDHIDHRPFPVPARPWAMAMRWHDLLFAHWPVPKDELLPFIPDSLKLDTFDGKAWLGIVPFWMSGVRPRYLLESFSLTFPELNVRTYVTSNGLPGVWFFSLDAANRLAVRVARLWYNLPYYDAIMDIKKTETGFKYVSKRKRDNACLNIEYASKGEVFQATPGTLDYWLTERYGLYATDNKGITRFGPIHHKPWALQKAEAHFNENTMTDSLDITLPKRQPVLHYSKVQYMVAWALKEL